MSTVETTEPKELARQARLLIIAARGLRELMEAVSAEELRGYRYQAGVAMDDMLKAALTCPAVEIAVFARGESQDTKGGAR